MCQAYDGERRFIVNSELRSAKEGFKAAYSGKSVEDNPHTLLWNKEAWDRGYSCFMDGIIPWGVERELREKVGYGKTSEIRIKFREHKEMEQELVDLLK